MFHCAVRDCWFLSSSTRKSSSNAYKSGNYSKRATVSHGEPRWATVSHGEPRWATVSHGEPRWATVSHGEPRWATVDNKTRSKQSHTVDRNRIKIRAWLLTVMTRCVPVHLKQRIKSINAPSGFEELKSINIHCKQRQKHSLRTKDIPRTLGAKFSKFFLICMMKRRAIRGLGTRLFAWLCDVPLWSWHVLRWRLHCQSNPIKLE